jgi:shikimate kinase
MMGSGKSTVGREVARRLELAAEDTDERVVTMSGRSISEIFETDGEPGFRALEREAIEALAGQPCVASLGGGAMAQPGMAEQLCRSGPVFYLMASPEVLAARVAAEGGRPLLEGLSQQERVARLRALLDERRAAYEQADHHIETDGFSADQVADEIVARLRAAS